MTTTNRNAHLVALVPQTVLDEILAELRDGQKERRELLRLVRALDVQQRPTRVAKVRVSPGWVARTYSVGPKRVMKDIHEGRLPHIRDRGKGGKLCYFVSPLDADRLYASFDR